MWINGLTNDPKQIRMSKDNVINILLPDYTKKRGNKVMSWVFRMDLPHRMGNNSLLPNNKRKPRKKEKVDITVPHYNFNQKFIGWHSDPLVPVPFGRKGVVVSNW